MESETDIEEGEACFQNINYDDPPIDPDVALSYIDEKIQNVLGHCQKDFEGGVSAENLGAKFGGYGSFLPTYQRSPSWHQPKTPPKVLAYSAPSSPHIEVGHQNSSSQTSASQPARSAGSIPPRGSSMNSKLKQEVLIARGDQSTSNDQQSVNNFTNDTDQTPQKVRIKVGSDNISTMKNSEIYSGLGLDVSPSSSLEASPVDSDGFIHVAHDIPNESPTSILEIMTSFPVSGNILLSPLPYDVLHLVEKENLEELSCDPVHKGSQESTLTALHGSDMGRANKNVLGEKRKSSNNNSASMESTDGDDVRNGIAVLPKKELSVDDLASGNRTSSSEDKRKSKGRALDDGPRNIDSKGGVKNDSFTSKGNSDTYGSKGCIEGLKKNSGKVRETYKDFFGELDLEQEDCDEMALEKPCGGNKEKGALDNNPLSKERLIGKEGQKPYSSRVGSHVPPATNGLVSEAAAAAPVVNEDWVCCDKCEKWRLLPPGINPGSLPEKWLCSMLDWLPGMNRCSVSEEETTKAITFFPGPSVQGSQPVHPGGSHLGAPSLDVTCRDGPEQNFLSQIPSKKKHGSKDLGNEAKQDRPSMSSNSSKKNLHTSYRSRSLNGANPSPHMNDVEFQDSGHSRDVITEKDRLKENLNNRLRENFMDEGNNIQRSKVSNKRGSTRDFRKDSKKIKTEGNDGNIHMGKFDKREVSKKRTVNEFEDPGKYPKERSETNCRKEKKARVLKTEDEEIRVSKGMNVEDVKLRSLDVIGRETVLAATSSSSKVSDSHKTKTNDHEVKGSPVESVSSSPMRILNNNNNRGTEPLKKNINIRPYEEKSKGVKKGKGSSSMLGENAKSYGQSKHKHRDGSYVRNGIISSQDSKKASKKDTSRKGKSHSLPPRYRNEIERVPQPLPGSHKENGGNTMSVKVSKQNKKAENPNGNQPMNVKDPAPNERKGKGHDGPVLLVRDISNQATTNGLREATNLKHMADRVKNGGSSVDSRALYMQAALKFLHVASLFESCHKETGRYGDMIQSISIYSSTAKLCEYCAHEYERTKDMATASLAYKCMEVAYMKVIYSSHATACKDVNELKTSIQMAPTGESPSSSASASDLDNLNNHVTGDKAAIAKGVDASQVAGNHVIAAHNKPNFTRLLNFTQDLNSAMEASRRSRIAFAESSSKEEAGLSAVKTALDFNFHDVEGLLHLVRVAMEAINR